MHIRAHTSIAAAAILLSAALLAGQEPGSTDSLIDRAGPRVTAPTGPSGIITTIAGDGYPGWGGNGGPAIDADLFSPVAVAVDGNGNIYIAESEGEDVRKIDAKTGIISVYAGNGLGGYAGDGKAATDAMLNQPYALALDTAGDLYIADSRNNVIREVNAKTGIITTVAGSGYGASREFNEACGIRTDGVLATKSNLCQPWAVAVDPDNNLYIADSGNQVIRKVTAKTGIITTIAGNGHAGYSGDGGLAVNARLSGPFGLVIDRTGSNLYIADTYNCAVRKVVLKTGIITSVVGTPSQYGDGLCGISGNGVPATLALFSPVFGLAVDASGNLFIADTANSLVRVVAASNRYVYTIAGDYGVNSNAGGFIDNPGYSGDGGPAGFARLNFPRTIALDSSGSLYIDDESNQAIRKVTEAAVTPVNQPVITPASGSTPPPVSITIAAPVKGSTIYYTSDGSIPTTSSKKYTGPIHAANTVSITAFATAPGTKNSTGALANYFSAPAPTITPAGESIAKSTDVRIADATSKAQIWYTIDGSNPTSSITAEPYTEPVTVAPGTVLQAAAWAFVTDYQSNIYGQWSPVVTAAYPAAP